jgi:hypothetical protein
MLRQSFVAIFFIIVSVAAFAADDVVNPSPTRADTLLREAIEHANLKTAKLAIDKGAKINAVFSMFGDQTPLWQALTLWQRNATSKEMVLFLLEHGADPNIAGYAGVRPLERCIDEKPDSEIIDALLKSKANVNLADDEGNTTLHYAVKQVNADLLTEILKSGAKINAKNKKGYTPMDWAVLNFNSQFLPQLEAAGGKFANLEHDLYNYRSWGKDDIRFARLDFVMPKALSLPAASATPTAQKDTTLVTAGETMSARAVLLGEPQDVHFSVIDENEKVLLGDLKPLKLVRRGLRLYVFFSVKIPKKSFRVRADGQTLDKKPYQSVLAEVFSPTAGAPAKSAEPAPAAAKN